MKARTIAILGNFLSPHSTESELAWTLENMGHRVLKFQENQTETDAILANCLAERADLLIYVHSHGWRTPGTFGLEALFKKLEWRGVTTASFHLDLFWGLHNDNRENGVGRHPLWKAAWVFTADGGHEAEFRARGVNHHWLRPALAERGCYDGQYRAEFAADVAFVGSRAYHPEYPFRAELIDWLAATYGPRFRHVNHGLREQRLNDFYASAKILVGDCCFSGIPKYWSDRVYETIGRGGFIVHPEIEGLCIPGMVTFKPRSLQDLGSKIDYYLDPAHEAERLSRRDQATAWVRKYETYTQRLQCALAIMGLN